VEIADIISGVRGEPLIGRKFDPYDDKMYNLVERLLKEESN
jgi:hypothetical protein